MGRRQTFDERAMETAIIIAAAVSVKRPYQINDSLAARCALDHSTRISGNKLGNFDFLAPSPSLWRKLQPEDSSYLRDCHNLLMQNSGFVDVACRRSNYDEILSALPRMLESIFIFSPCPPVQKKAYRFFAHCRERAKKLGTQGAEKTIYLRHLIGWGFGAFSFNGPEGAAAYLGLLIDCQGSFRLAASDIDQADLAKLPILRPAITHLLERQWRNQPCVRKLY